VSRNLHRRLLCAAAMALLIPCGLVLRFVSLGLPQLLVKYGGSFLWAAMLYLLVALLIPQLRPVVVAVLAAIVAAAVEYAKLIQTPGLDAFRDTFAGKVLLGRYFSHRDIAVYWIAILCVLWIDRRPTRGSEA
jgi:hypothetical protein